MRFGRTVSNNNMVSQQLRGVRSLALALTLIGSRAAGFGSDGVLSGRVLDQNGEPIPGALVLVEMSGQQLRVSATTDHQGTYSFEPLEVGEYSIRARHAGFRTVSLGQLRISPGARLTWSPRMAVAQLGMEEPRLSELVGGLKRDGHVVTGATVCIMEAHGSWRLCRAPIA
jgi:hypothetical protein